eukprot:6878831-Alexandrium_andersonii.AAC.1
MLRPRTPSKHMLVGRFGFCARSGAECTPRELQGPLLRPLLGLRSSNFERLKQLYIVCIADCGWRRIAALKG